jgi:hypothetical protein
LIIGSGPQRARVTRRESVGGSEVGVGLDTAGTSVVAGDSESDVAVFSEGGVPGVLDEPVLEAGSGVGAVASNEDGVVELSAASVAGQNTRFVVLEDGLVGLNGDGEGLSVNGRLHLGDVVGGDISVGEHSNIGGGGGIVLAGAASSEPSGGVGVDGLFSGVIAILVVLVSVGLETTTAAVVAVGTSGALNELLLRESLELTSCDVVGTLKAAGGGESPA